MSDHFRQKHPEIDGLQLTPSLKSTFCQRYHFIIIFLLKIASQFNTKDSNLPTRNSQGEIDPASFTYIGNNPKITVARGGISSKQNNSSNASSEAQSNTSQAGSLTKSLTTEENTKKTDDGLTKTPSLKSNVPSIADHDKKYHHDHDEEERFPHSLLFLEREDSEELIGCQLKASYGKTPNLSQGSSNKRVEEHDPKTDTEGNVPNILISHPNEKNLQNHPFGLDLDQNPFMLPGTLFIRSMSATKGDYKKKTLKAPTNLSIPDLSSESSVPGISIGAKTNSSIQLSHKDSFEPKPIMHKSLSDENETNRTMIKCQTRYISSMAEIFSDDDNRLSRKPSFSTNVFTRKQKSMTEDTKKVVLVQSEETHNKDQRTRRKSTDLKKRNTSERTNSPPLHY